MKRVCKFFGLVIVSSFVLGQVAEAGATYTLTINNQTNTTISLSATTSLDHCISDYGSPPSTISAGQSATFDFNDTNAGGCISSTKTYVMSLSASNGSNVNFYFNHAYLYGATGIWHWNTQITQGAPTGMLISAATCNNNNCFNAWYDANGTIDINVNISNIPTVQNND